MEISRREFVSLIASAAAALASPTLLAQSVRLRREIRTLSAADVTALASGVAAMKTLPKENFRSWLYQSGVHGALPGEEVGVADAATYWNQCVHSGLHFLSWHRWELLFIEEIIRLMSDQCQFTLPYWDYLANGFLPDPLRLPADASNPLFDATRSSALNDGTGGLSGLSTAALSEIDFGNFSSILYGNPHSAVHGLIGGNMGDVPTAARDPVFYLHHCNIDRYWECWIGSAGGRMNPGSPWRDQTFPFHSLMGQRNALVGDGTRTADLGYTYDNLPCSPPIGPPIGPDLWDLIRRLRLIRLRLRPPRPIPDPGPLRALASTESFTLNGRPTAVVLARRELRTLELEAARSGGAIVLADLKISPAARSSGFFFEVWLAPSVRSLQTKKMEGARRIGSFSRFDIADPGTEGRHRAQHAIRFDLNPSDRQVLASGKEDVAVLFVRRGLVDKSGKPLPFDDKAELISVGAMQIVNGEL